MFQKKCAICGEVFYSEKSGKRICPKDHYNQCPICGKKIVWNSKRQVDPCSKECRKERTRRKNIEKYGVEHPMQSKEVQQHHKQAMLDKYGVESPLQSKDIKEKAMATNREKFGSDWALGSKEIKEKSTKTMIEKYGAATTLESTVLRKKVEQTCLEKYGVTNVLQSKDIHDKITNTNFLRYGVSNVMQNPDIHNKMRASRIQNNGSYWTDEMADAAKHTSIERYGVSNPSKSEEIKQKIKNVLTEKYGENYGDYLLRNVTEHNSISLINKSFMARLNEKGIEGTFEFTGIPKYRYDIAISDSKTLIEINPTYSHNIIWNHWDDCGKDPNYHKDKTEAAKAAGYRCINVFDWDDWDSIINLIIPKTPVYARKCTIYKLNPKVADDFIRKYHLQGAVRGQQLCLGLVYQNELVQVMTFGKPRYNKNYYAELLRLCSKPDVAVIGGAERLFKFATDKLGVEEIISYCDLSKFNGEVYQRIGMKLKTITDPQEIWSKNDRKITANLLRQRGFDQLFGTDYGKGTDNNSLMLQDGWLPVCDCGQAVYTY